MCRGGLTIIVCVAVIAVFVDVVGVFLQRVHVAATAAAVAPTATTTATATATAAAAAAAASTPTAAVHLGLAIVHGLGLGPVTLARVLLLVLRVTLGPRVRHLGLLDVLTLVVLVLLPGLLLTAAAAPRLVRGRARGRRAFAHREG